MRKLIAAAGVAMVSAGAAQAAVYQYDLTLEATRLTYDNGYLIGRDVPVPNYVDPADCNIDDDGSFFYCDYITYDALANPLGNTFLDQFAKSGSAQLVLESNTRGPSMGKLISCQDTIGYACVGLREDDEDVYYSADANGFSISVFQPNAIREFSSDGFLFVDDASYSFDISEGLSFGSPGGGITIEYKTTSIAITEISPVPLPASLPLLTFGLGGIWAFKRRKSA